MYRTIKTKNFCGFICIFGITFASAQVDTLNGIVSDSATNAPLESVNVASEGLSTTTQPNGAFSIALPVTTAIRPKPFEAAHNENGKGNRETFLSRQDREAAPSAAIPMLARDFAGREAMVAAGIYVIERTSGGSELGLGKASATLKPHTLVFSKAGYRTGSVTAPASNMNVTPIEVRLTAESGGVIPAKALESLQVGASGESATSNNKLDSGEIYLLKAFGTVGAGADGVDAEFGGFTQGTAGTDSIGGVDVGVDFGLKTSRVARGFVVPPGRMKWYGAYRKDHVYYVTVNGTGRPLSLKLLKQSNVAVTGNITVSIVRLSPAPSKIDNLLDSIPVFTTKGNIISKLTTEKDRLYLLQCDGQAPVGGAGLGMGDADFMDYKADGSGQLDIGDLNTDYGLGVDEPFTGAANTNSPRKRWWGLWRKDHIYYMLFTGTGAPITFTYYDTGYGDNSKTIPLTVRVFAVP